LYDRKGCDWRPPVCRLRGRLRGRCEGLRRLSTSIMVAKTQMQLLLQGATRPRAFLRRVRMGATDVGDSCVVVLRLVLLSVWVFLLWDRALVAFAPLRLWTCAFSTSQFLALRLLDVDHGPGYTPCATHAWAARSPFLADKTRL
jgi:hypothetical protein